MVLFVSYSGVLGGAERLLVDIAGGLPQAPALACPEGPLADAARAAGLPVFALRARALELRGRPAERARAAQRLAAHTREVRRVVRALGPELVIAWGMRSAIACTLGGALGRPVVFHHNDLLPGAAVGALVRAAAARADLVVASSHAIARDLDPDSRLGTPVTVVHPGVDLARFPPPGRPAEPPEVVVLGALVDWKRPDLALEAIAIVRRTRPDVRLRLVGASLDGARDDGLLERLRERAMRPDLGGRSSSPAPSPIPDPSWLAPCVYCTAPTERGLGWPYSRRWRRVVRPWCPPPRVPPRSSSPRAGSCTRPAMRRQRRARSCGCSRAPSERRRWAPAGGRM